MKKILLIFLHGFGDNIMATPAVKELSETYEVDIVVYDKTSADKLWMNLDFVSHVYSISLPYHPRYWNPVLFWLKDFWMVKRQLKKIAGIGKYAKVIFSKIYIFPHIVYFLLPFLLKGYHKIDQIAYELGIKKLKNRKTIIKLPDQSKKKGENFLKKKFPGSKQKIITMHLITTDQRRDFPLNLAAVLIDRLSKKNDDLKFIVIGTKDTYNLEFKRYSMHLNNKNLACTYDSRSNESLLSVAYMIQRSVLFLGIDSGPFHIAGAFNVNTIGIFRSFLIKSDQRKAFNDNVFCFDGKKIDLDLIAEKMSQILNNSKDFLQFSDIAKIGQV